MALCEEMTNQPKATQFNLIDSGLKLVENLFGALQKSLATYRANVERRDAFKNLQRLDQRTLKDIGLTQSDVTWASKLPLDQNAACELQKVRNARLSNKI